MNKQRRDIKKGRAPRTITRTLAVREANPDAPWGLNRRGEPRKGPTTGHFHVEHELIYAPERHLHVPGERCLRCRPAPRTTEERMIAAAAAKPRMQLPGNLALLAGRDKPRKAPGAQVRELFERQHKLVPRRTGRRGE